MKELYEKYKNCIVQIIIKSREGEPAIGSGFHIGDGYVVTARHVVENNIIELITGDSYTSQHVMTQKIFYPSNPKIDLAVLETDFSLGKSREKVEMIPLGGHLDDWIGEEFVLSRVVTFGYPRIPQSKEPVLVAVQGEINAIIDKYAGPHPHFIISSTARGGFSGGPVISEYDFLLGVFTKSLTEGNQPIENGFASVISIEPLLVLLYENNICISKNDNILYEILNGSSS